MPLYCAVAIGGHCNSHEKNVPRVSSPESTARRSLGSLYTGKAGSTNTPNSRAQQHSQQSRAADTWRTRELAPLAARCSPLSTHLLRRDQVQARITGHEAAEGAGDERRVVVEEVAVHLAESERSEDVASTERGGGR